MLSYSRFGRKSVKLLFQLIVKQIADKELETSVGSVGLRFLFDNRVTLDQLM